jgi:hypothetical protein
MEKMEKIRDYCIKQLKEIEDIKKSVTTDINEKVPNYDEDTLLKFVTTAREYELRSILDILVKG